MYDQFANDVLVFTVQCEVSEEQLKQLLKQGFLKNSVSPWSALVLFIKKKDDTLQLCIDY